MPLLDVIELRVGFPSAGRVLYAVDGVSLQLEPGETLGIVGESGSGKSSLGLALLRLLPKSAEPCVEGRIVWDGRDLLGLSEDAMRGLRGRELSMVLQDPVASLNPVLRIGDQVGEAVAAHTSATGHGLRAKVIEALQRLRISQPETRVDQFPHQLSGGMQQRVVGAIALASSPRLLIADEPTTSLDVTVQAHYFAVLRELQQRTEMAMLLITHDLGIVARTCDRVAVMYAGQIVESARVRDIFHHPAHWYTAALIDCIPARARAGERLATIPGSPRALGSAPAGCRFAERCENAQARCRAEAPPLIPVGDVAERREVRCFFPKLASSLARAVS
jgi:oligopeptide/dipeptide ABC transporter ATP-binding protein